MLLSLKKIYGIGKYAHFDGNVELSKNQVFFGFNGSGKSTLSDIFYSLSDEEHCNRLMERKTLQKENGDLPENPQIKIETSDGMLEFLDTKWNHNQNIYVFNDQYIADYVTIINGHDAELEQLVLGKEGNKILRLKEESELKRTSSFKMVNNILLNNKSVCGILGLGKTKITLQTKNWIKKVKNIADTKLYQPSQKEVVQKSLNDAIAFDEDYSVIQKWIYLIEGHQRYLEESALENIRNLTKILKLTPMVTNKEIADHISKYMAKTDVNWLVEGMNNRADSSHCPFCGQELTGKSVEKLSRQLDKFIKGKQKQKADRITFMMKKTLPYFDEELMEKVFETLQLIKKESDEKPILHKSSLKVLEKMQTDIDLEPGCFHGLYEIVNKKMNNPYIIVNLNEEEKNCLRALNQVIKGLGKLKRMFEEESKRIQEKIAKTKEFEKTKALFDASFGENSENMKQMISAAQNIVFLSEKIIQYQERIDNLAETKRIEGINSILEELNVNYRVNVSGNKFYVKITGYMPAEYQKENQVLCSEGERRILAFAYFMQEVFADTKDKIVVIDDPISSLDLSRKSVVAYKIVQLMGSDTDQIIVLSHDISFIEKISDLESTKISSIKYIEICKNIINPFRTLVISDYLVSDKVVYEKIINGAIETLDSNDRLVALMSLRPYAYVTLDTEGISTTYKEIEKDSTYFHHSVYSHSKRIKFEEEKYNCQGLRKYCDKVKNATGLEFDTIKLIPDGYNYNGLDYEKSWDLYNSMPSDNIFDLRKKALAFRVLLETTLFMLLTKAKFDPEHISKFYNNAVNGQHGEKKRICEEIKKMYDLSKKYHHGAEEGSTLGLSDLNPDEMLYFDKIITEVHEWIKNHISDCNPNNSNYMLEV